VREFAHPFERRVRVIAAIAALESLDPLDI
jgi:hypothetical protein